MLIVILFLQSFFVVLCQCCSKCEIVSIKSNGSVLIGRKLFTIYGNKPYGAFWKIPFAEPPVKRLRFKPPEGRLELLNNKTRDYSSVYNESCAMGLDEDCLYLSVYTPLTKKTTSFPVLVWIHEYSYSHWPDFFIDEGVMVVTVSFRTSVLGFLNTGDDFATGNMGAKDILMALKWIRNNIWYFNGDYNKVTVAGSGDAANIVASFLVSPAAEDLYRRIIIHSGSALSPAHYKKYNFETINKLYWKLNGPFEKFNRKDLYNILDNVSTKKLLTASRDLFDSTEVRDSQRLINAFALSVESYKGNVFMNKHPKEVYKRKMSNNCVEVLIGYNNLESLHKLKGFSKNKKLLNYLNHNFQYILPFEGDIDEYGSKRYKTIRKKIKDFFFVNGTIAKRSLRRYAKYLSDQVIYPLLRQAKLHTEGSCTSVYLYRFSFKGSLNIGWLSSVDNLNFSGATAGDEICYLFRCESLWNKYSADVLVEKRLIKRLTRLWANFVKYGNPTPNTKDSDSEDLQWTPLIPNQELQGLNIGRKVKVRKIPEEKRMKFWEDLRNEYFVDRNMYIHNKQL